MVSFYIYPFISYSQSRLVHSSKWYFMIKTDITYTYVKIRLQDWSAKGNYSTYENRHQSRSWRTPIAIGYQCSRTFCLFWRGYCSHETRKLLKQFMNRNSVLLFIHSTCSTSVLQVLEDYVYATRTIVILLFMTSKKIICFQWMVFIVMRERENA